MKSIVRWAIDNSPAMNVVMIGILVSGIISLTRLRREAYPIFEMQRVLVTVDYPGASPEEVEQGICEKIEHAVRLIDGIRKMTSVARQGVGAVVLELRGDVRDVQRVVGHVRSEVDRIRSFPALAERPDVRQDVRRELGILVSVVYEGAGRYDALQLRLVAEQVRADLLQLPTISHIRLRAPDHQIDIEVDQQTLTKHGLTLQKIADIVRRENLDLPAGTIHTAGQDVLVRGKNKRLAGVDIAQIPVITTPEGVVLTVEDLGTVRDEFTDMPLLSYVNGEPAIVLAVDRTMTEDLIAMADDVRNYVSQTRLPSGYKMDTWLDFSVEVRERINMLTRNGCMGLLLVFVVLAMFLEARLAVWVALGIPISMLGAFGILLVGGQTLNLLSMFACLTALGIVVDDAIVIGENIYAHREMGKSTIEAAIDGTAEVMPSVIVSVTTTLIAFSPLMFVSGVLGNFIAVLPLSVIAMLLISLFESTFILPCHLAHSDSQLFRVIGLLLHPLRLVSRVIARVNSMTARLLNCVIELAYVPFLKWSLGNKRATFICTSCLLVVTIGILRGGFVEFVLFPKVDGTYVVASVVFPDGTPPDVTEKATRQIEDALLRVNDRYSDPVLRTVQRSVGIHRNDDGLVPGQPRRGSHFGGVDAELVNVSRRDVTSAQIIARWRKEVDNIPGVQSLTFRMMDYGPEPDPIAFSLRARNENVRLLEPTLAKCREHLASYEGVHDVDDDYRRGKWSFSCGSNSKHARWVYPWPISRKHFEHRTTGRRSCGCSEVAMKSSSWCATRASNAARWKSSMI